MEEIYGDLMDETEKAWKFAPDGEETNPVWVPKSIAEWEPDGDESVSGTMFVPTWFAEKEGMV